MENSWTLPSDLLQEVIAVPFSARSIGANFRGAYERALLEGLLTVTLTVSLSYESFQVIFRKASGGHLTRSSNPYRNRKRFPSGNEFLPYGRRFKPQRASTQRDLRIASPTCPFFCGGLNTPNRNPQAPSGRRSHNRQQQGH